MDDGFGLEADTTEKNVDREIDSDNFFKDFIRFSRDNQLLNEQQAMVVMMGMASGLMDDHEFYTSILVTGGASGGKSHMLDEVITAAFEYGDDVNDWLYELTGGSDKAAVDDEDIDDSRFAYFHELQKIPDEMLEFIKTVAEDGEFRYGRNVADADSESGRTTAHVEREPLPVLFSFADENTAEAGKDQELRSRMVEVKVDESPEKNMGVHDMKWGGEQIELPDSEETYIRDNADSEDLAHVIKAHLRDAPVDVDAVIPYGNDNFDGDDWKAARVTRPMFNFSSSDSTRASANLAGLTMGSAICNYHARDYVCTDCGSAFDYETADNCDYECPECDDSDLQIVIDAVDVANVIACRPVLLATTHGLTDKKFAVLDAILERGGQANASGTAVHATKQDIIEEIQQNDDIATLTKSEINNILEELNENLIINITDNPEDRRENLYVYDGSDVFEEPDIMAYYDRFSDITDPILDQPIEQTIQQHLRELNAKVEMSSLKDADSSSDGDLSSFDGSDISLNETEQQVAERLSDVLDDQRISESVMAANSLRIEHMVGDTPVEYDDNYVFPEREPNGGDKADGFISPDTFDEADDFDDAESIVTEAVASLRESGVFEMTEQDDGSVVVTVDW